MLPGRRSALPTQLVCRKLAAVCYQTVCPWTGRALLLPGGIVLGRIHGYRVLNPLDDLGHGDEVRFWVALQDFVDPVQEGIKIFRVVLQPCSMEEQTERGPVLVEVTVEVVSEEVVELVSAEDVGA